MKAIDKKPLHFRTSVARAPDPQVVRGAGVFESGLIEDVSIITRGEALGHDLFIDQDFLSDVAGAINASSAGNRPGLKARFTHPGLSSDGVGKKLGRVRNARVDGDQVLADLHFQHAATKTPDGGDLADYVMTLAEETPEDFGVSIVFDHDLTALEEHVAAHGGEKSYQSPDPANTNNFVHAQLETLRSADVVDSPAANPEGLFCRGQEAAIEGEAMLEYALGISDVRPSVSQFSVDPDRLAQFVQRFLERHELSLTEGGDTVSEVKLDEVVDTHPTREDFAAELDRFVSKFGAANGTKWFTGQISYEAAMELHLETLTGEVERLNSKVNELEEVISSLDVGESDGAEFVADEEPPQNNEKSLKNRIRIVGRDYN